MLIHDYIQGLEAIWNQMCRIGMNVEDSDLADTLIICLNSKFNAIASSLTSQGLEVLKVHHCPAHPLTPRLVKMGYFPSAPLHPWLAFNNSLMLFSSALFVNTVPNITGFMETIVAHLKLHSYNTPSAVSNPLPNMIVLTLHQESL